MLFECSNVSSNVLRMLMASFLECLWHLSFECSSNASCKSLSMAYPTKHVLLDQPFPSLQHCKSAWMGTCLQQSSATPGRYSRCLSFMLSSILSPMGSVIRNCRVERFL